MFGLFGKKGELKKLNKKYQKLMEEYHRLSSKDRAQSDQKYLEAEEVLKEIELLQEQSG